VYLKGPLNLDHIQLSIDEDPFNTKDCECQVEYPCQAVPRRAHFPLSSIPPPPLLSPLPFSFLLLLGPLSSMWCISAQMFFFVFSNVFLFFGHRYTSTRQHSNTATGPPYPQIKFKHKKLNDISSSFCSYLWDINVFASTKFKCKAVSKEHFQWCRRRVERRERFLETSLKIYRGSSKLPGYSYF
jgi:hypothetical protein